MSTRIAKVRPFKPMRAANIEDMVVIFPVYGSPKLDGIRGVVKDGSALSNSLKLIRNVFIQDTIGQPRFEGLDGELTVGPANHPNVMQASSSGVMSADGEPDFNYWVFDLHNLPDVDFEERLARLDEAFTAGYFADTPQIKLLEQVLIFNMQELDAFEAKMISLGFEGVMIRKPKSPYKYGRSTAREGYIAKVKRFTHEEGTIVGFEEVMTNLNEQVENELGQMKRSGHAENLVPAGRLGAYWIKNPKYPILFKISCGSMGHIQSTLEWNNRHARLDTLARYKFFPHGMVDAPRHGLWDAFRDPDDMS